MARAARCRGSAPWSRRARGRKRERAGPLLRRGWHAAWSSRRRANGCTNTPARAHSAVIAAVNAVPSAACSAPTTLGRSAKAIAGAANTHGAIGATTRRKRGLRVPGSERRKARRELRQPSPERCAARAVPAPSTRRGGGTALSAVPAPTARAGLLSAVRARSRPSWQRRLAARPRDRSRCPAAVARARAARRWRLRRLPRCLPRPRDVLQTGARHGVRRQPVSAWLQARARRQERRLRDARGRRTMVPRGAAPGSIRVRTGRTSPPTCLFRDRAIPGRSAAWG